jgi:hypothetical protein
VFRFRNSGFFYFLCCPSGASICRFIRLWKAKKMKRQSFVVAVLFVLTYFASTVNAQSVPNIENASAGDGDIHVAIRDSSTGFAIAGSTIKWEKVDSSAPVSLSSANTANARDGVLHLRLTPGDYGIEISAPGYDPMRTHAGLIAGASYPLNIFLDPVSLPDELQDEKISAQLKDGFELVQGYVCDASTHLPILGVTVRLLESGATAVTDERGYFSLYAPTAPSADANGPEDLLASDTLIATATGYQRYQLDGLLHASGSESVIRIDLNSGSGASGEHFVHGALLTIPSSPW